MKPTKNEVINKMDSCFVLAAPFSQWRLHLHKNSAIALICSDVIKDKKILPFKVTSNLQCYASSVNWTCNKWTFHSDLMFICPTNNTCDLCRWMLFPKAQMSVISTDSKVNGIASNQLITMWITYWWNTLSLYSLPWLPVPGTPVPRYRIWAHPNCAV